MSSGKKCKFNYGRDVPTGVNVGLLFLGLVVIVLSACMFLYIVLQYVDVALIGISTEIPYLMFGLCGCVFSLGCCVFGLGYYGAYTKSMYKLGLNSVNSEAV